MSEREPKYWTCVEAEVLNHTEIEDALDEFLDDDPENHQLTVEVTGFAPMVPDVERIANHVLDDLLENILDDEYGGPDGYTKSTDGMKEAAKAFVGAVLKEYNVYNCEEVCKKTVALSLYRLTGEVKFIEGES